MLDNILRWVTGATTAGISLIGLAIVLQVVFGGAVPFLGGDVIGTVIGIVGQLGDAGLVGLIAAAVLWKLFTRD
tara:strand:- start:109 stop:330 length:222 start_codon:yes stop_codon:yes gene_type:complete